MQSHDGHIAFSLHCSLGAEKILCIVRPDGRGARWSCMSGFQDMSSGAGASFATTVVVCSCQGSHRVLSKPLCPVHAIFSYQGIFPLVAPERGIYWTVYYPGRPGSWGDFGCVPYARGVRAVKGRGHCAETMTSCLSWGVFQCGWQHSLQIP